jgi:hypothetical protein
MVMLVNVSLPAQSVIRPAGLNPALADYADKRSSRSGQWPTVRWPVADKEVPACVWRFAGWWAGGSDAVDDVYLTAVGFGREPEGLSLAALQDGSLYHFDLAEPLLYSRVIWASKAARVRGDRPLPLRQDWHPGQLRIIASL